MDRSGTENMGADAKMTTSPLLLLLFRFLLLCSAQNINPVSTSHAVESHHSIHRPIDKSQAYWTWGGSAVATKDFLRLTPAVQARRGWLWNQYPIESDDFEVEFKVKVESKGTFGGDGFAFWLLDPNLDPSRHEGEPDWLNGPIFGLKEKFTGIGVCFDTYDNDNRRNNPQIFVLENFQAESPPWGHDTDFTRDMVTRVPDGNGNFLHPAGLEDDETPNQPRGANSRAKYKCVAEYRSTGKMTKILVKYLHKTLHVYVDTLDGKGYRFCLAVTFPQPFRDYHIALTSATGQLVDNVDVLEISTRYLSVTDSEFDDYGLPSFDEAGETPGFWEILMFIAVFACVLLSGKSWYSYYQQERVHIDTIRICRGLNKDLMRDYAVHFGTFCLALFTGRFRLTCFNLPLTIWRALSLYSESAEFMPVLSHKSNGVGKYGLNALLSTKKRLLLEMIYFLVMGLLFVIGFL
eukprot:g4768.t1